jgi:hypothetical protein
MSATFNIANISPNFDVENIRLEDLQSKGNDSEKSKHTFDGYGKETSGGYFFD